MRTTRKEASVAKAQVAVRLAGHDTSIGLHIDDGGGYAVRVNVASEQIAQAVRTLIGDEVDGVPVRVRVVGQVGMR
ncbi:hypothetical protein [Ruania alba]|uniref:BON domain-containing protein n=1 Tax=Ruania alba TaxID=648782 RepID=A0A1H5NG64_9MICO|nr:hypothetical protein [Ruania alba]SEF00652.1 hypothetical protein SAMN04488554_4314 [Ruania alba]